MMLLVSLSALSMAAFAGWLVRDTFPRGKRPSPPDPRPFVVGERVLVQMDGAADAWAEGTLAGFIAYDKEIRGKTRERNMAIVKLDDGSEWSAQFAAIRHLPPSPGPAIDESAGYRDNAKRSAP